MYHSPPLVIYKEAEHGAEGVMRSAALNSHSRLKFLIGKFIIQYIIKKYLLTKNYNLYDLFLASLPYDTIGFAPLRTPFWRVNLHTAAPNFPKGFAP